MGLNSLPTSFVYQFTMAMYKKTEGKTDPQLVLLSVHNDCCNLLVHEDQDSDQKSWKCTCQVDPPGVFPKGEHKPSSIQACGLEVEFGRSRLPERLGQERGFMLLIGSLLCACSYPQLAPKLYVAQNMYSAMGRKVLSLFLYFLTWKALRRMFPKATVEKWITQKQHILQKSIYHAAQPGICLGEPVGEPFF